MAQKSRWRKTTGRGMNFEAAVNINCYRTVLFVHVTNPEAEFLGTKFEAVSLGTNFEARTIDTFLEVVQYSTGCTSCPYNDSTVF